MKAIYWTPGTVDESSEMARLQSFTDPNNPRRRTIMVFIDRDSCVAHCRRHNVPHAIEADKQSLTEYLPEYAWICLVIRCSRTGDNLDIKWGYKKDILPLLRDEIDIYGMGRTSVPKDEK